MLDKKPKSILSLDVGLKRIGLAGCDPLGITVTPLPALIRSSFTNDVEVLKRHCQARKVEGLVVGLPLDQKGLETAQAVLCKKYGQKIARRLDLPVAFVNEHSSTWAAGEKFNLNKDRSGKLDSAAAALLLEQWLREGPVLKPVQMASYPINQLNCDSGC